MVENILRKQKIDKLEGYVIHGDDAKRIQEVIERLSRKEKENEHQL